MAIQVEGGWLNGSMIRSARKTYKCQYYRGKSNGGVCRKPINPGDLYVEGESYGEQTRNGIFVMCKYCPTCAGPAALATIAMIGL